MVDFSSLLRKPAFEAKKPEVLPVSPNYLGIVTSFEVGESQNDKKTPFVRFNGKFLAWADDIPEDERHCDITKRSWRRDFYLTDEALFRLDEFLRALGVGSPGAQYEEIIPEVVGQQVKVSVKQYLNKRSNELANETADIGAV